MSYQYGKAKQVSVITHYQVVAQKKQLQKKLKAATAQVRELQASNLRLDRRINHLSAMCKKEKARADELEARANKYEDKYTRLIEQFGKEKQL